MIRLYSGETLPLPQSRTAVRFSSLYACYGDCAVVHFWWGDGLLLYSMGATLHIALYDELDAEGLAAFVCLLGFNRIYCAETLADRMGWRKQGRVYELVQAQAACGKPPKAELKLQEIYDLLICSGGAIELPPFADFCVDFSHRLRHGGARYVSNGKAIALTDAETETFAHIGGVAVSLEYRSAGVGSRMVQGLCTELQAEGKTVLTSTVASLLPFYQKNGFIEYKRCCYCTPQ